MSNDNHPSPLRYPGGKSFLTDFLAETTTLNKLEGGLYVEPFAGGAGAALRLLFGEHVGQIHLNDIDPRIFSFWKSVLDDSEEFVKLIEKTPLTVAAWKKQKEILQNPKGKSRLEIGFATFYLNRTNRSGVLNAGPIGGMNQDGNYLIDARFNRKELSRKIEKIALYRERITLSKRDAVDLLEEGIAKKEWPLEQTLVYLDPPYHEKGKLLYSKFFLDEQHTRLANFLNGCSAFRWVISYDDASLIHNLYEGKKNLFLMSYSVHRIKVGRELIIGSADCLLPTGHFVETDAPQNRKTSRKDAPQASTKKSTPAKKPTRKKPSGKSSKAPKTGQLKTKKS